jgi:hypothetical protein
VAIPLICWDFVAWHVEVGIVFFGAAVVDQVITLHVNSTRAPGRLKTSKTPGATVEEPKGRKGFAGRGAHLCCGTVVAAMQLLRLLCLRTGTGEDANNQQKPKSVPFWCSENRGQDSIPIGVKKHSAKHMPEMTGRSRRR